MATPNINLGSALSNYMGLQQLKGMQQDRASRQAQLDAVRAEEERMRAMQNAQNVYNLFGNLQGSQLTPEQRWQSVQQSPFLAGMDLSSLTPEMFTDEGIASLRAASPFAKAGEEFKFGTFNPRDYTASSFAEFTQTRDPRVLERTQKYDTVTVKGTSYRFNPATGEYDIPQVTTTETVEDDGVTQATQTTVALTPEEQSRQAAEAAAEKSAAEKRSAEQEKQSAAIINEGRAQARSIPTLKQTIQLLDQVQTGGWTNRAKQWAKQRFGVESADEGVLTANLGKAVLSQLRQTFGAAFTEREGARLAEIEAGFGKSPETNKALLSQLLQLAEMDVANAISRAEANDDQQTVNELRQLQEFEFDLGREEETPAQPASQYQEGQTATNPATGEQLIFRNGAWQPL